MFIYGEMAPLAGKLDAVVKAISRYVPHTIYIYIGLVRIYSAKLQQRLSVPDYKLTTHLHLGDVWFRPY
jgi:hypothetical protein